MLIDTRDLPRDTVLEADLCIIGGGAAGITIARELIGSGLDVALLESGEWEADPATQMLYDGESVGEPLLRGVQLMNLANSRLRFFGGTTNHWVGWCRPYDPIDFEVRDYLPISGWPISRDDLLPFYERAGAVIQLGPFEFGAEYWSNEGLGPVLVESDRLETGVLQAKGTFKFGEVYRSEIVSAQNVTLYTWANVTEIVTRGDGGGVEDVVIKTLSGNEVTAQAKAFVLAVGGIDGPRLLLASNAARPAGIGNENDLVGRYFCEHIHAPAGVAVFGQPTSALSLFPGRSIPVTGDGYAADATITPLGFLRPTGTAMKAEGLLGFDTAVAVLDLVAMVNQIERFSAFEPADFLAYTQAITGGAGQSMAFLSIQAEQSLVADSRVTLMEETDALGVPKPRLNWQVGPDDRQNLARGIDLMARELGRQGVGRLKPEPGQYSTEMLAFFGLDADTTLPFDQDPENYPIGIGFHHMCATRMDPDPTRGVVDTDCRIHSVDNLYVSSASVFPTPGAATPTMTIVALALRLADHLKSRLV